MNRPFRALLLAAGLGTRLRPITLHQPKCLVQIGNEPLLGRWLRQLEHAGCEAVLVNTHYLAQQVESFLQKWHSTSMKVDIIYEPDLLGTAGTLLANNDFFEGATGLLIHADNVMEDDICSFLSAHANRCRECLLTMLTFTTSCPNQCGIVELDNRHVVQGFHEKVSDPPSNRANGAIYAFEKEFLDYLRLAAPSPSDFSTQVLPYMLGKIQTWHTDKVYIDIGTPEQLSKAQSFFR